MDTFEQGVPSILLVSVFVGVLSRVSGWDSRDHWEGLGRAPRQPSPQHPPQPCAAPVTAAAAAGEVSLGRPESPEDVSQPGEWEASFCCLPGLDQSKLVATLGYTAESEL